MTAPDTPQLARPFVTDGGLETDLIFHRGYDLPDFAAYPLLDDEDGRATLRDYYRAYGEIAAAAGAGLLLETPTWRASADWGRRLGHDEPTLARLNRAAVAFLRGLAADLERDLAGLDGVLVNGNVGPRGDGYAATAVMTADEARDYHRAQVAALADGGADGITALTLTYPAEAVGLVRAARETGLPVGVGLTVETDGRLPDGTPLRTAIAAVDAEAPPDYYLVNCAHPTHVAAGIAEPVDEGQPPEAWAERIRGLRSNASALSHAELDEATELDQGDPDAFGAEHRALLAALPAVSIRGGCCGTDARHVASLWGVPPLGLEPRLGRF